MEIDMDMQFTETNCTAPSTLGNITEFPLNWPVRSASERGSTHELVMNEQFIFVSGQNMNLVAKLNFQGEVITYYDMRHGDLDTGPHGLLIDGKGRLWVSLEFSGEVVRLDEDGNIVQRVDVRIHTNDASGFILNTAPHGIGLDADGESIWFTGKRTSTIGKISADGTVTHYELATGCFTDISECRQGNRDLGNRTIR
ncbi:hypothetical protein [Pedobacter gandavensis]|uniref:hypothetical protein n=1 Tax=Pedobacter gandavensis TaxID=2679963 RepID=UPI00292F0310|nr:hypothetical protein [Pedobacter gandavensis]